MLRKLSNCDPQEEAFGNGKGTRYCSTPAGGAVRGGSKVQTAPLGSKIGLGNAELDLIFTFLN